MIYCKKSELFRYMGLSDTLDTAIRFVHNLNGANLVMGRNAVDDERVFINRFDYQTMPEETLLYESHVQYADIHMLLSGEEDILVADEKYLVEKERDEAADYIGLDGECEARLHMTKNHLLIVFPHEAHKVKCQIQKSGTVQKAVVKVLMEKMG